MLEEIKKYIENGMSINKLKDGRYIVYTDVTRHFIVNNLDEIIPERFEMAITENKISDNLLNNGTQ
jgi:hypothetical protein